MLVTSAAGLISLLDETAPEMKSFALKRLDTVVDEFWPEISEAIEKIEVLYEDKVFKQRELAALVASKVYYNLGSYDDSLNYALSAGTLFDVNSPNQYVETIIAKCIDQYTNLRIHLIDDLEALDVDPRLEAIVNRMFQRCLADGQYKQALGIAMETRRLDIFQAAIVRSDNVDGMLKYAYNVSMGLIQHRGFRNNILRHLVELYRSLTTPDYISMCQCYIFLDDPNSVATILKRLSADEMEEQLTSYQIAFDLYESATQEFLALVIGALDDKNEPSTTVGTSENTVAISNSAMDIKEYNSNISKLKRILSGEITILLHLQFLIRSNKTDFLILRHSKDAARASICHTAVVIANAFMNSGTTSDYFLRENLEWLTRASNWAKMTAVASLGVIHRGHEKDALNFMQTYLPKESGPTAGYTESGGLYALGLIHANRGSKITPYLLQQLKDAPNEIIKHGGCLGLGLAAMGTCSEDVYEQIKFNLYQDDAVVGEAAGIAMGLIMLGSKNASVIHDMVSYCNESQHEKILRGLAVGIAFTMFGRLEEADDLIQRLISDKDPILRRSGMFTVAMAFCGTGNNRAIRRLLHVAVSDVNDDVRRAAVIALGFLLFRTPDQCPNVVSLLAESYNPHVRYGAAMALGIACAGTGLREAITILEPMIQSDRVNFVRQGALIASAMICVQQTEQTCPKVTFFRQQYAEVVKDKHEDVMAKFGAILAQGIIDAGGRNTTMCLQSRTGHVNMLAVVGTLIFTQYWYWFPLSHCLSLAFTPTSLIGLNGDLNMPKMQFKSNSRPSMFAYPPPTEEKKREEMTKTSSALLSIAARRGRRDKYKLKMDVDEKHDDKKGSKAGTSSDKRSKEGGEKEKDKDKEKEADFEIINNPARVMQQQLKVLGLVDDGQYIPIKDVCTGGIIMVRNIKPEQEEIVELVAAHGPRADDEKEPEAPEPFEWNEN